MNSKKQCYEVSYDEDVKWGCKILATSARDAAEQYVKTNYQGGHVVETVYVKEDGGSDVRQIEVEIDVAINSSEV
jgi:hypothetical protein